MNCISVICILAKKWYLMHMCVSWLCPLKHNGTKSVYFKYSVLGLGPVLSCKLNYGFSLLGYK